MRVFDFQLKGFTHAELQRRRQNNQKRVFQSQLSSRWLPGRFFTKVRSRLSPVAHVVVWSAFAVAFLYGLNWTYTTAENHPAAAYERLVFGSTNVIILPDNSKSMTDRLPLLQALIDQLQRNGVSVNNQFITEGGGFASAGPENNSLHVLETALSTNPVADTIFVFSDFNDGTYSPDVHDEAGFQRLRELLRGRSRRLYLGTVYRQPPSELIEIARQSGGGLFAVTP